MYNHSSIHKNLDIFVNNPYNFGDKRVDGTNSSSDYEKINIISDYGTQDI